MFDGEIRVGESPLRVSEKIRVKNGICIMMRFIDNLWLFFFVLDIRLYIYFMVWDVKYIYTFTANVICNKRYSQGKYNGFLLCIMKQFYNAYFISYDFFMWKYLFL
jgi:hypothetical protein